MRLYTIGFAGRDAETFFRVLRDHRVRRVVDIRANPRGQLSAYARQRDLPYFLSHLADGCQYIHLPELAPTREMLTEFRADGDWSRYVERFEALMDERGIPQALDRVPFEILTSCLLCSEAAPERCHRRLVAERLAADWPRVEVVHL
jgi:uncharacterized protein (DUF488 family)